MYMVFWCYAKNEAFERQENIFPNKTNLKERRGRNYFLTMVSDKVA